MARIFVTGSADGLGQMAARLMVKDGHRVVLHARNEKRAKEALATVPGVETAVSGDLSSIAECKQIAAQVNVLGAFDAVIHNAGVGYRHPRRIATADGLPHCAPAGMSPASPPSPRSSAPRGWNWCRKPSPG